MSDKTVKQLAEMVKIPLDRFIEQLQEAGISASNPDDLVDEEERIKLLSHLRKRHGKSESDSLETSPKKITLKRRKVSELKQVTAPGVATKTINVEVRKKKTYIKRSEPALSEEQIEVERAKKALDEQRKQIAAEEEERQLREKKAIEAREEKLRQIEQQEAEKENAQSANENKPEEEIVKPESQDEIKEEEQIVAETNKETDQQQEQENVTPDLESEVEQEKQSSEPKLTDKELEAKRLEEEKKARLEASIERNAEKVRKQAEAKKQQTLHKKKQKASGANKTNNQTSTDSAQDKKKVIAPGRGEAMPTGTGKKSKAKKGKQKRIQMSNEMHSKHQFEKPVETVVKDVKIPETIIVSDLAQKMSVKAAEVIKQLMKLGVMSTINQPIDQETAAILVEEMGHKPVLQSDDDLEKEMLAEVSDGKSDQDREQTPRAPIVTIMGHVDHGKTSLLDYIRETRVASGEAGGITQHIGAYQVKTDHGNVTFLDTPGHAAFTAMRARGAEVTDVVIVVVAADDGVMPQTKEAIEHARAADVPIIVAINKMDKAEANPDKVMQEMATLEVVPEEWGGDVQFLRVSAKTGLGIDDLIEALILQTEILELTAPEEGAASGFVIESRLDKGRGAVATLLVQKGTLKKGEIILCGQEYGRVRAMFDETGSAIDTAGPSAPVEVLGLSGTPGAGDEFLFAQNEKAAKELAELREERQRSSKHAAQQASKLDDVFSKMTSGDTATLNLVIKTDVQGSLEALRESLVKLSNEEVTVKCVYGGVGGINEGDANLALASGAILIGFNVRADATARKLISESGIDLHYYSIIYEAIDEVKRAISGMLAPDIQEQIVGLAEVRDVFRSPKFGAIAGCMVIDGYVKRNLPIRVLRDNVVIYEGQLESLRRFKDDVNEVKMGMECGIGVKNYNDVKNGDQIEVYERIEIRREV